MSGIEQSMARYYAARASEYDRVYQKPERQADIERLRQELPPLFAGARVLEVACGTGYWTQFIAHAAKEVVALDLSRETLAIATRRAPRKVSFVAGDAYCLPVRAMSFGAAFVGFWLSHVPLERRRNFLLGLHAVLRPGATVVMVDNLYVEGSNHPTTERDERGDTYQHRKLDDGSTHRVLKNFPTQAELLGLVETVGTRTVYRPLDYYWVFQYVVSDVVASV